MQKPPKRWEIFTSKKGCEGAYRFITIFRWSCRKNYGGNGGGGVEVLVERMRVEKRAYERKQKKWNEGKGESEPAKEKIR